MTTSIGTSRAQGGRGLEQQRGGIFSLSDGGNMNRSLNLWGNGHRGTRGVVSKNGNWGMRNWSRSGNMRKGRRRNDGGNRLFH